LKLKIAHGLLQRVIIAVLSVVAAVALRFWPLQNMGTNLAYVTFFPAVTIAALYGGRVSGVLATILSTSFVYFWQYRSNPNFEDLVNFEGMAMFFITGILIASVSEAIFRARIGETQAMELARHETQLAEEAKLAQQEIAIKEARFRELFENSPTGMVAVDPKSFHFIQANLNAQRMYGYSEEELRSKTIADLTYPDDLDEAKKYNERLAKGLIDKHFVKKRYLRKDGSYFWAQSSISTLRGSDGKAELFIGSFIDITELEFSEITIAAYVKQLEDSVQGTLLAVSAMVEQRDPYTSGHERRVGIIAEDIAREMGWPEKKCKELQMIGLAHDIGKIGIPAEILSKPSKLTALEYELIKTHVEKGYEILKDVKFPMPIAEIIFQHHERMDGSGYPLGLKEQEILPEARILAIADVLESMASHRPYRPALGVEVAIKEIESHRGTLYWANAVDALLRLIRDKGYQLPT
jgi:PAS domain S-box-containing protein/putative nucleotidyltransferase with HDIG domain